MAPMPSRELIDRVAELRGSGRTPKEIARALGLKPAEVAPLIRAVGASARRQEAPVAGCWVSGNWSAGLTVSGHHPDWPGTGPAGAGSESGLMGVLVAREHGSSVSAAGFLVDVWCMGVKNTQGPKTMDRRKLPDFLRHFFRAFSQPPVAAPLELARHAVFGAVDYARGLGLEPHPDFAKCAGHLGEWTGPSDITFGRDGMPLYIEGPHDNALAVISKLRQTAGEGNFRFVMGVRG
jgi:hypothetical protein